jgi:hypothetical protein
MCIPGCYLSIPSHLGLNNLDFNSLKHDSALFEAHSGYKKIYPDIAHFEAHSGNLGDLWHFEGS